MKHCNGSLKRNIVISIFLAFFISFNNFAAGQSHTILPGITIYSEYYRNPTSNFKGTIIFINGSGTDIDEWKSNQEFFNCVSKIGSIFLYDRSGIGKSPPNLRLSANHPITAKLISDELFILLERLNIKPPYIFVAHSYGAVYAGYFVLKHPALVRAVLLVDPVPRDFNFSESLMKKYHSGINAATTHPAKYIYKKYSGSKAEVIYQMLGFNESKRSIKQLGNINRTIPVVILSSTGMEIDHPLKEDWYINQKQWLNKNQKSKITRVTSDHFIQLAKPQQVCKELKIIVNNS